MRINVALVLYLLCINTLVFVQNIHSSVRHAAKRAAALESRFPVAGSEAARTGWCLEKQIVTATHERSSDRRGPSHRAAERQVRASARSDSCSCYNCLANNNYLQMSADEGLANGEAGGLC